MINFKREISHILKCMYTCLLSSSQEKDGGREWSGIGGGGGGGGGGLEGSIFSAFTGLL